MKKICFISSSGGHLEQLQMLQPIMKTDYFIITEKIDNIDMKGNYYYLQQINRREILVIIKIILNAFKSLMIFVKEKPDIVICTGALSTIPFCIISKIFNAKLIYIESYAKVETGSLTGKLMYRIADKFYVQWSEMLNVFPKAIFKGGIY
jgi:beta-1,4-N-acetylglucosaminyltransferase